MIFNKMVILTRGGIMSKKRKYMSVCDALLKKGEFEEELRNMLVEFTKYTEYHINGIDVTKVLNEFGEVHTYFVTLDTDVE